MKKNLMLITLTWSVIGQNGYCQNTIPTPLPKNPKSLSAVLSEWETNSKYIIFHGRVVDQFSNSVADAAVTLNAPEPTGILQERARRYTVRTDQTGCFEISEKTCQVSGLRLTIENIEKDGYIFTSGGSKKNFLYDKHYTACHVPEKAAPVVFNIRKKESEQFVLFKSHDLNFQIRAEKAGTAVGCDFVRRSLIADVNQASLTSGGTYCDFQVIASLDTNSSVWTVVMRTGNTNDGIVVSDQLLYLAPEGGYSAEYTFKAENHKVPKAKYVYLRNRDSNLHTRLEISGINANNDFFRLWTTAVTNPYGDRNLEEATNVPYQLTKQLADEVKKSLRENKRPEKPDLPKRIIEFNEEQERKKVEREKAAQAK